MAGLWEFVRELPKAEETSMTKALDPEGISLSGGQMQKLMLARTLYKNAPVVILDEPTAALDPVAENELYQKYSMLTEGKTSIFISHRLSSTRFCDRILLFDHGKVMEEGTHEELMKQNGAYAKMYEVQAKYYRKEGRNPCLKN
jgi:ATP-binding cassette subfamily B protein